MALLDNTFKQRMVGALVLIALAVIFLPMLFSRQDEMREVRVEAPAAPKVPAQPQVQVQPVQVPEQQAIAQEPVPEDADIAEEPTGVAPAAPVHSAPPAAAVHPAQPVVTVPKSSAPTSKPSMPIGSVPGKPAATTSTPALATAAKPATAASAGNKIDPNGLPVSWSVQLASLASREGADNLQKTLRTQGYNAYVRSAEGKNRVYVGPLVDRAEAERLRDTLNRQQSLKGFVVRFEPERG